MEVDDFVRESMQLIQPLEDFFNNVFVMVVCVQLFVVFSVIAIISQDFKWINKSDSTKIRSEL